jgi:hypothetical protein
MQPLRFYICRAPFKIKEFHLRTLYFVVGIYLQPGTAVANCCRDRVPPTFRASTYGKIL